MKKFMALVLCCLSLAVAHAQQPDKLTDLMNEREQLVMEYQFYNQQNSNFWGKKSKNDLLNIIQTLKKIINADSELIAAIKEASIKKVAESTVENQREGKITLEDQRIIKAQMAELQSQIKMLQVNLKKKERTVKDLEMQLADTADLRYGKDKVISMLAVVAFILLLYAVVLQVRLNRMGKKAPRKKVAK